MAIPLLAISALAAHAEPNTPHSQMVPLAQTSTYEAADGAAASFSLLPDLVVVAARRPQPSAEVVGQVSAIELEDIERLQAQELRDLIRYEPGVAVSGDPARFGADSFNIRGIEGNRVAIEIDGVPLPDGFSVGRLSSAGRDLVDPELIRRVEILRGPASTLYGSDALGGVVAFSTRDPSDLARQDDAYAGAHATFTTRDDAMREGLLGAWQGARFGALALYSQRRGHETENNAREDETPPNPADTERESGFVKLTAAHAFGHASLTLDHTENDVDTDVRSVIGAGGQFSATQSLLADDRDRRDRALLSLSFDRLGELAEEMTVRLFAQRTQTEQDVLEQRRAQPPRSPAPVERQRHFEFDSEQFGAEIDSRSTLRTYSLQHTLVCGLEFARTDYEELRDGRQRNLLTGAVTNVILGEDLPVRDFPNSTVEEWAAFATDEITLPASRWTLIGGVHYEHYRVDAQIDPLFAADNPGAPALDLSDAHLSPKIALRFAATRVDRLYAAYVEGFRAPPFSDINIALAIPQFNYLVLPNPDLEPERSRGVELGWTHDSERWWWQIAVFDNHYEDLIESRANLGVDASGATIFQSINRERARIYGVEANVGTSLAPLAPWLDGVNVHGAFAWAHGDDTERDHPLNTIQPAKLVFGIEREARSGWPELGAVLTAVSGKGRIDRSKADLFEPPGYVTLDLRARFAFARYASLDVGLFNVFDKRYWEWSNLRGVTTDNIPAPGFFTEPGRNAALTLRIGW